jgi:alkylation response protein AidB-like acyl-CoA dehydrogenase
MFLIEETTPDVVATPEKLTNDQKDLRSACRDFVQGRIASDPGALETHEGEPHVPLMKELGQLGYLGVDVPERWGGLGMGTVTGTAVMDEMGGGGSGSFTTTFCAHIGIATWPVMYFGTDAQREKYLTKLVSAEYLGAYALTEPQSGSDALAANTTAMRLEDGSWELNGGKIFITNAAFADVYTVFAKVDGQNACFLVDRGLPGFTIDKEEHKLGIKGSSTRAISFDKVKLPPDALLGEVGQGHKVVLNTLNLGRFKLAVGAVGGMKQSLRSAVMYAIERKQFGRPIAKFGAVRQMLAQTAVDTYVAESIAYRVAGLLEDALHGAADGPSAAKAIHSCSVECAIAKYRCSDLLYGCRDREVQVFGGNGFIEEYSPARALRDARIFRIFEGTNEINALLVPADLLKRAMKGEIPMAALMKPALPGEGAPYLKTLAVMKKAILRCLRTAAQKYMQAIADEQEVLLDISHAIADVYGLESAYLRLAAMEEGNSSRTVADAMVIAYRDRIMPEFLRKIARVNARIGQEPDNRLPALAMEFLADDTIAAEIIVGDAVIAAEGYPL